MERYVHPFLDMAFEDPSYAARELYKGISALPEKTDREIFSCISRVVTDYHYTRGQTPADMFIRRLEEELGDDGYVRKPGQGMNEHVFEVPPTDKEIELNRLVRQVYSNMRLLN